MSRPPLFAAATALGVCLAATSAFGAPARSDVVVLRPPAGDRVLVEASARLLQELGASGMTSALVGAPGDAPTRVVLGREAGLPTIDVVARSASGASVERRVRVRPDEGGNDPSVLAVRAVELLRGLRLEVHPALPVATPPPPRELESGEAPPPEPRVWQLAVGASAIEARPYSAALAVGPTLAASVTFMRHASVLALVAGPFSTDRAATPIGSAHTREELGLIGFRVEARAFRVEFHAAFTAGLHHLDAAYDGRGLPTQPLPPLHVLTPQSVWTPIVAAGAGAGARLWRHVGATVEVTALIAQPAVELFANGRSLGTIGGPSLMQTLWAWVELP